MWGDSACRRDLGWNNYSRQEESKHNKWIESTLLSNHPTGTSHERVQDDDGNGGSRGRNSVAQRRQWLTQVSSHRTAAELEEEVRREQEVRKEEKRQRELRERERELQRREMEKWEGRQKEEEEKQRLMEREVEEMVARNEEWRRRDRELVAKQELEVEVAKKEQDRVRVEESREIKEPPKVQRLLEEAPPQNITNTQRASSAIQKTAVKPKKKSLLKRITKKFAPPPKKRL